MKDRDQKKEKRLKLWAIVIFFIAIYLIAFFIGSSEFQGIEESFRSARSIYHIILGSVLMMSILTAGLLYFKLSFTTDKIMKILIVIISASTFLILFFSATIYVNRVFDKKDPTFFDIHVTDSFVLTLQSKDGKVSYDSFIAFDAPEELRNYSVVFLLNSSRLNEFPLGKKFRVERHPGCLGLPWLVVPKQLSMSRDIYKNKFDAFDQQRPYCALGKQRLKIVNAKGMFTPGSPMSRLFKKHAIPIN